LPFALLLPVVALPLSDIVWGYAAAAETSQDFALSLALFAPGLVFFTVHYLMLRGFYSLERTRTVFWVQCVIAAVNVALAVLVTSRVDAQDTAPGLVIAYAGAYGVGAMVSYLLLRSVLGGLETPALLRFAGRTLLAAAVAAGVAWAWRVGLDSVWGSGSGKVHSVALLVSAAVLDVVVFLLLARVLRVREVNEVVDLVSRRLRR
jgi:putative peptidoglycan lipid II flippase